MPAEKQRPESLYRSALPLWIAVGAFALFVLTLSRWVSVLSLGPLVRATGDEWSPLVYQPLTYLVTLPTRLVPDAWQPLALNLLAAVCGAVTLGLLARSVILLPHDRTEAQRHTEPSEHSLLSVGTAWLPPALAVLVAALQLTFWEHATSFSGEMLDLLVLAFCAWSLLEYRLDRREGRLFRLAFIYGLGVTNNFAMIGFFPLFVTALIWIKGRSFFNARSFLGMTVCGALGLLLYLLPPVMGLFDEAPYTFWQVLKANWSSQWMVLRFFPKYVLLLVGLTSLLPLLLMAIRWPSRFGDTSHTGAALSRLMFHIVHLLFLAACLYVAFDEKFSPRQLGLGLPFLTFYYLGALAVGYFSGYFLVVFHPRARRPWDHPSALEKNVRRLTVALVVLAAVAVPAALAYRNLGLIRVTNGPALREFAMIKATQLPAGGGIVLSDDPINLRLVEIALRSKGAADQFLLLDTRLLSLASYQREIIRRQPGRWPEVANQPKAPEQFDSPTLIQMLAVAARSNRVCYLHPSFGYYFEAFHLAPYGLVYELDPCGTGEIARPALTTERIAANNKFWEQLQARLEELTRRDDPRNATLTALKRNYSLSANYWGVELQRHGDLAGAGRMFEHAIALNAENASAEINRAFNHQWQAGKRGPIEIPKSVKDRFGKFRTWDAMLGVNGPIDDPAIAFELGREFARNYQYRQSAYQFARVAEIDPPNLGTEARLAWIGVMTTGQRPDDALKAIAALRGGGRPLSVAHQVELIRLEARAQFTKGERELAERTLQQARAKYPQDESVLDALSQIYLLSGRFADATAAIDEQLRLAPDSVRALLNRGAAAIQLKDYASALAPLNRALDLSPRNPAALMNRAIALLQTGKLEEAGKDYKLLLELAPNQFAVHYGLGEIAYRQKNRATALKHYQTYLNLAPTNSDEAVTVRARLDELRGK
jgi:tetratricopeptide (TPR) repeat protein